MKNILQKLLASLSKSIIKKYQPRIVGITGSIGKTSSKEAIFSVLNSKFNCRKNIKNYNNEIGVPLTIIGTESGGRSLFRWFFIILKALRLILLKDKNYPEVLVLEMGADKPGDIGYLVDIASCFVGVVTKVSPVHIEFFKTLEKIAKEKRKIVSHLNKENFAILNTDDNLVAKMSDVTKAEVITYGYNEKAKMRAIELFSHGEGLALTGLKFKLSYAGSTVPVFLPRVIGKHQIYSAMAAAAVGMAFEMNLIEVANGLKNYQSPKGRMNLISGLKNSLIIDDSYNSSPEAAQAAVETVINLNIPEANQKVAVLGDMLELGDYTEKSHYNLGKRVADLGYDILFCVGKNKDKLAEGALKFGLASDKIFKFNNSVEASRKLKEILQENSLILIKGSQGARMEKVVLGIMQEPERAVDLLVRQDKSWQNK